MASAVQAVTRVRPFTAIAASVRTRAWISACLPAVRFLHPLSITRSSHCNTDTAGANPDWSCEIRELPSEKHKATCDDLRSRTNLHHRNCFDLSDESECANSYRGQDNVYQPCRWERASRTCRPPPSSMRRTTERRESEPSARSTRLFSSLLDLGLFGSLRRGSGAGREPCSMASAAAAGNLTSKRARSSSAIGRSPSNGPADCLHRASRDG